MYICIQLQKKNQHIQVKRAELYRILQTHTHTHKQCKKQSNRRIRKENLAFNIVFCKKKKKIEFFEIKKKIFFKFIFFYKIKF